MSVPLKLSAVKPDFESLILQLGLYLQSSGTWADLQTSSTGQTLMEMMAAVGAFNQFAIESAARETTLTTAARDSSIYAITRMLGVRIHRKYPAGVNVHLTRKDSTVSEVVQPYTPFSVNGAEFFNRNPLMFAQGSLVASERLYYGLTKGVLDSRSFRLDLNSLNVRILRRNDRFTLLVNSGISNGQSRTIEYIGGNVGDDLFRVVSGEGEIEGFDNTTRISVLREDVRLYEGTIRTETFISDGIPFKQIYLAEAGFNISDVDILVRVFNEQGTAFTTWRTIDGGMWLASDIDNVFHDSTSGLGEAIITFGDGTNGAIPKLGTQIQITYATTKGSASNNGLNNLSVATSAFPNVEGKTISVISGGADEKPSSYYRFMAPLIFKARNRGVTGSDYLGVSLDYPGVISASIMAQRDVAPHDLRWMNQVQICLLPIDTGSTKLTQSEWDEFLQYIEAKKHAAVHIVMVDPQVQYADIELTVALKLQYIPSSVLPLVEQKVRALFARQSDTLGRRITVSDVVRAAMVEGVDYVDVNKCKLNTYVDLSADLIPVDATHYIELRNYLVNTKYSERTIYGDGSN